MFAQGAPFGSRRCMGGFAEARESDQAGDDGGASVVEVDVVAVPEGEFVLDEKAGGGSLEGWHVG